MLLLYLLLVQHAVAVLHRVMSPIARAPAICPQRLLLQVIAEHKSWTNNKDLAGRIYLSTQGINAQYSGLTAHAEGYAKWLQTQDLFKVDVHQTALVWLSVSTPSTPSCHPLLMAPDATKILVHQALPSWITRSIL